MRRVLRNTGEVFHYWANQIQSEGKSGSVSFDGDVIWSYAQPIARLFPDLNIALLSNRRWSITTSGHQSAARRALPRHWRVVYAPVVGRDPHNENKRQWEDAFMWKLDLIKKHPRRTTLLREANEIRAQYEAYRTAFQLDWPDLDAEALGERLEAEQREAAERAELYAKEQEERRLARIAEQTENLAKWRVHDFVGNSYYFEKTALRLSQDGTHIETSRGATVPTRVAARLWPLCCSCRSHKAEYRPRNELMKVGVYTLIGVDADGSLEIGCHYIPWDELVLMAEQLGFPPYSDELVYKTVTDMEVADEPQENAA